MESVVPKPFWLVMLATLVMALPAGASDNDALAPKSRVEDAVAGPLHTVTIATTSLEDSLRFYRDGLGMSVQGPLPVPEALKAAQRQAWGITESVDWQLYRLDRDEVPMAAAIRLLVLDRDTPHIHASWDALELGPFSMGFPNADQEALDSHVRSLGFGALNDIEKYEVPRTDGSRYPIHETIFNGPDYVHGVGIHRGGQMAQLGYVHPETGLGGPAYSAQVVADSDAMIAFLVDILGYELRSDRIWESAGSEGALNVPDGTVFRFSILYARGATTGHLLLVDYQNRQPIDPGVEPRLPNRGIGLWSFQVQDLDSVLTSAAERGQAPIAAPMDMDTPLLGRVRVATLLAPNGFPVELFEVSR